MRWKVGSIQWQQVADGIWESTAFRVARIGKQWFLDPLGRCFRTCTEAMKAADQLGSPAAKAPLRSRLRFTPVRQAFRACVLALSDAWTAAGPDADGEAAILSAHGYTPAALLLEAEARLGGRNLFLGAIRAMAEDLGAVCA